MRLRLFLPLLRLSFGIFLPGILALPNLRAGSQKVDVSKIHGRIQIVESFPDYRVQVVTAFPDLRVQKVKAFPNRPGQWQIVDSFPDFKIQFVTSFPDFKVQFVTSFPGADGPARGTSVPGLQIPECLLVHSGLFEDRPKRSVRHIARVHWNIGLPAIGVAQDHM